MSGFLLDTNVLSEYVKPKPDAKVHSWLGSVQDDLLYVSVLTFGEIQRGITSLPWSPRRTHLQTWLDGDLKVRFGDRVLPLENEIADRWGRMMAHADSKGRPLPIIDSLLAATALHHNLTFATRDTGVLAITGVQLLNPWQD